MKFAKPRLSTGVVAALSCVLALETALYSAVTPLLPYYADRFDLEKTAVGLLAAFYAGGIVVGSLAGVRLVATRGVRATVSAGLVSLAAATLAFGWADSIWVLDGARFAQGLAAGCMWAGALSWLLLAVGERRGSALGGAMGMAVVGTIAGPVVGTVAAKIGPQPVYTAAALTILLVALVPLQFHAPVQRRREHVPVGQILRGRALLVGIWLVLFPGALIGGIHALVPLRLDHLGATEVWIGAVFLMASVIGAMVSPLVGRLADRTGPLQPALMGLLGVAAAALVLALAETSVGVGFATVGFVGVAALSVWVPAMTLVADSAQLAGAGPGVSAAILNIAIAVGEAVGSPSSAWVAQATDSDSTVFVGMAAGALLSAAAISCLRPGVLPNRV